MISSECSDAGGNSNNSLLCFPIYRRSADDCFSHYRRASSTRPFILLPIKLPDAKPPSLPVPRSRVLVCCLKELRDLHLTPAQLFEGQGLVRPNVVAPSSSSEDRAKKTGAFFAPVYVRTKRHCKLAVFISELFALSEGRRPTSMWPYNSSRKRVTRFQKTA